jgi:hypothetical protein
VFQQWKNEEMLLKSGVSEMGKMERKENKRE